MKATVALVLLGGLSTICVEAAPVVDETYPYTGPAIPVGDWVNPTVNGNGKGFPRLVEPPAVKPTTGNPTNNVNVISLSYLPEGINVHYQTPFGLGVAPTVNWGTSATKLDHQATGYSHTYDRTPPCSLVAAVTQCSQFFHEVQISSLQPDTTYYYQIPAANGTTVSDVLSFTTARAAGDSSEFTVAVLNDMGYTNAAGTYKYLMRAVEEGISFAWHGGDLSYADDWYSGILPCEDDWPVCYNGTSSELPGGVIDDSDYNIPLPTGEIANQGGPEGGDMSVLYESNWDLWQQWINTITTKVPYMVLPGNHEASCGEFDGPKNILTAYLNDDEANSTAPTSSLTYYSCPPSQRNFTAYQNRFRMPGDETGGVGNFWYSFDYGLAHFISLDGETDFANSPEYPFAADIKGDETHPTESQTFITDSGPFGAIDGSYKDNTAYAQYKWLAEDLASVDRTKTPWIIAMSHRPMYSSNVASYQTHLRAAFQDLLIKHGVDAYFSGHIHWYERMFPLTATGAIDSASIVNNNTYYTNGGVSMTHIINGMAGNVESHSELDGGILNITAVLDVKHYGFSKLTFFNSTALKVQFILGDDGSVGDEVLLLKPGNTSGTNGTVNNSSSPINSSSSSTSSVASDTTSTTGSVIGGTTVTYINGTSSGVSQGGTITSSVPYTTSTVYKTVTSTISSCASSVTNCPYTTAPITVTDTIIDYTTVCPVSATAVPTSTTEGVTSSVGYTSSVVHKTVTSTVSSCKHKNKHCSYTTSPTVVVSTTVDYTTSFPVSATAVPTSAKQSVTLPKGCTRSAVHKTITSTISSCKNTHKQCSYTTAPITVTDTIVDHKTVCHVSATAVPTSATHSDTQSATLPKGCTRSAVHKTITSTISSCKNTHKQCSYTTAPITVTDTIVDHKTVCHVSATTVPTSAKQSATLPMGCTRSAIHKTITSTISSCKNTHKQCSYTTAPITVTDTIVDHKTVCPVSATAIPTSAKQSATLPEGCTRSAVHKTITSTISSCKNTHKQCSYTTAPITVTDTIVDHKTICPISATKISTSITQASSVLCKTSVVHETITSTISTCKHTHKHCSYTTAPTVVVSTAIHTKTHCAGGGASASTPAASVSAHHHHHTTTVTPPKFTGSASNLKAISIATFVTLLSLGAYIL